MSRAVVYSGRHGDFVGSGGDCNRRNRHQRNSWELPCV
jgi:hypothetical protein